MDRPVPGPTGSAPLFENDLGDGSGLTELAKMKLPAGQASPASPAPESSAPSTAPAGDGIQLPPNLPPHLRGPQASPAPVRESHYGRWVVGTFAIIVVGVLVIRAMSGDDPDPASTQPATPAAASGAAQGPATPKVAAGPSRAQQWEQVATVLGELERHVNRAKLQFADIQDPAVPPVVAPPQPEGAPSGVVSDVPQQARPNAARDRPRAPRPAPTPVPSPSPSPSVDPAEQARAAEMWRDWTNSWDSDLEFAIKGLPVRATLDPSVRTAYDAVARLIEQMRAVPGGNPPKAIARDAWLRALNERVHDARKTVDASR